MARQNELTARQKRAIDSLLKERSVAAAADAARVGERTLHRWIKTDATFRAALSTAEGDLLDGTTRRLVSLADAAIDNLADVLGSAGATDGIKLRAADLVLSHLLKMRELRTLEQRVAALEERANDEDYRQSS